MLGLVGVALVVAADEERKAPTVSNLLVVLCGDRNAQPVVNTEHLLRRALADAGRGVDRRGRPPASGS